jgi:hypothetical protein
MLCGLYRPIFSRGGATHSYKQGGLATGLQAQLELCGLMYSAVFFLMHEDAQDWAKAWNTHKLHIAQERTHSPHAMFFFGMIQNGARGLEDIMGID